MATSSYILFPHGPTWQIATVTGGHVTFADMLPPQGGPHDTPPKLIAERLAAELARLGYTGQGVMLALPASDCLAASIDITGLARGDRKAMLYRLEEKLPMAAESIVADFVVGGNRALGACVREDVIAPLLHSLENFGVAVQSISPVALLAAQQLAEAGGSQILLIGEGDQINVLLIRGGVPVSWSLLPARNADLKLHVDMLAMESDEDLPLRACGVQPVSLGGLAAQAVPIPPRQVTAIAGAAALENRLKPWIEFRRGSLAISDPLRQHRRALDALLGAVAVFLICLTLGLLWRAHRYQRDAQAAELKMADEFSATFPGWSVPVNIKTIVEKEHQKLITGGAGGLPPEANESAMRMLHAVLSRLPDNLKFKIEQMTFNDATFELQGRVRAFGDVDAMATAARQAGIDVPPPQAHRDAEGFWTFTLRGTKTATPSTVARQ